MTYIEAIIISCPSLFMCCNRRNVTRCMWGSWRMVWRSSWLERTPTRPWRSPSPAPRSTRNPNQREPKSNGTPPSGRTTGPRPPKSHRKCPLAVFREPLVALFCEGLHVRSNLTPFMSQCTTTLRTAKAVWLAVDNVTSFDSGTWRCGIAFEFVVATHTHSHSCAHTRLQLLRCLLGPWCVDSKGVV